MADHDTPDGDSMPGCCNAKTQDDGRCWNLPINGTGRCRFHGGASTGPRDPSKLEGNDHAAGNSGSGAPELNMNASLMKRSETRSMASTINGVNFSA